MEKVDALLECAVEMGNVAGVVAMVTATGCEPYAGAYGDSSPGEAATMSTDTIFQVSSMVRPILTVAALTLVESGRLGLDDPLGAVLPGCKRPRGGSGSRRTSGSCPRPFGGSSRCGHC